LEWRISGHNSGTRPGPNVPLESEIIKNPPAALKAETNSLAGKIHCQNDKLGLYFDLQLEALKK